MYLASSFMVCTALRYKNIPHPKSHGTIWHFLEDFLGFHETIEVPRLLMVSDQLAVPTLAVDAVGAIRCL